MHGKMKISITLDKEDWEILLDTVGNAFSSFDPDSELLAEVTKVRNSANTQLGKEIEEQRIKATREQFEAYERVRVSGVTNMYDVQTVSLLSSLTKQTILEIMKRYSELMELYPGVRKE